MKHTVRLAAAAAATLFLFGSSQVLAEAFPPAPTPQGTHLGGVVVNPFGNTPLVALINRNSKDAKNIQVTVHGRGEKGVDISYKVSQVAFNTYDGVPVWGMYPDHHNKVTVSYELDGKKIVDNYTIITGAIANPYIDSRNISALPTPNVKKIDPAFRDRLYFVNSGTRPPKGSLLNWVGNKTKGMPKSAANPSGGSIPFETIPLNYVVDTQGEFRWFMDPNALYDGYGNDVDKKGYAMGFSPTGRGTYTLVQGQKWYELNLMGQIVGDYRLPNGYIDASHATWVMPNGHVLMRAAKARYVRPDGQVVQTVRDTIIEVDRSGRLIDVWDLNKILDPTRDALIKNLDLGAVCMNVDETKEGQKAGSEPDAPFGDAAGVGTGRNWAHVNSVAYVAEDDSIIVSARHQGVAKIGRDKQVKWILAPSIGWNDKLSKKLLKPVTAKGEAIKCSPVGECENSDFDFTYTQHAAWPLSSTRGNLVIFDNGQIRHYDIPPVPSMNYSRMVEYKIDEKNMTVQQVWAYGKERGAESFAPITSNAMWRKDKDTMFGFFGSVGLFTKGKGTIGRLIEVDYKTKDVKVEIDIANDKPAATHYQGFVIDPNELFNIK